MACYIWLLGTKSYKIHVKIILVEQIFKKGKKTPNPGPKILENRQCEFHLINWTF